MEEIYSYINEYTEVHGVSPSISDIAAHIGCSGNIVHKYLLRLEEEGRIQRHGHNRIVTKQTGEASVRIPILGHVPCGPLTEEFESCDGYVRLPVSMLGGGKYFILTASGDSMTGAGIDDGDLVLISQCDSASDGDVVVALVDNEVTLKRFYNDRRGRKVILHPENDKYSDIVVSDCVIQGVAVKVIKDIN